MTNRRRVFIAFLAGLILGVAGALLAPRFLQPYLPESVRGQENVVRGTVRAKRLMNDRLLLTIVTPDGAILATFVEDVPEVSLLVEEGDTVALALSRYEPFVTDPRIRGVRKGTGTTFDRPGPEASDTIPEPVAPDEGGAPEPEEEEGAIPPDTVVS